MLDIISHTVDYTYYGVEALISLLDLQNFLHILQYKLVKSSNQRSPTNIFPLLWFKNKWEFHDTFPQRIHGIYGCACRRCVAVSKNDWQLLHVFYSFYAKFLFNCSFLCLKNALHSQKRQKKTSEKLLKCVT